MQTLSSIFQNKIFIVPDYQRGYAWQNEQISDLLEDIEDLQRIRRERPNYMHRTGTLTVKPVLDTRGVAHVERAVGRTLTRYEIVDGQQRLTTLTMLINEISIALNIFGGKWSETARNLNQSYIKLSDTPLFRLSGEINDFFKRSILGYDHPQVQLEAHRRLFDAKVQLREHVSAIARLPEGAAEALDELSSTITDALGFIYDEVEGEHEVAIIFETTNSRGLGLTQFEKTKNLLFFLAGRAGDTDQSQHLFARINQVWLYTRTEFFRSGKAADEDQFLRYHWAIFPQALWFYENRRDGTWDIHQAIKKTSKLHSFQADPVNWLAGYLDSLTSYIGIYCDIIDPYRPNAFTYLGGETTVLAATAMSLGRIGREANLVPLLMAATQRSTGDTNELNELFRLVENFSFRLLIQGRYSNVGRSRAFDLAFYTSNGNLTLAETINRVRSNLINYYCNDEVFQASMSDKSNFYDRSGIRFFLFEFESFRAKQQRRSLPIDWSEFMKMEKVQTIEHILPQGDGTLDDTYWASLFTDQQWLDSRHRLGNLCISERGANSGYSNRSFPIKCGIEPSGLQKVYINSHFQSERDLGQFSEWSVLTIEKREAELIKFALQRWRS